MEQENLLKCEVQTPVGTLYLCGNEELIKEVSWEHFSCEFKQHSGQLDWFVDDLKGYLKGKLEDFSGCLSFIGADPVWMRNQEGSNTFDCLSKQVMQIISKIPYGSTRSYGSIGDEAGNKRYARAVGNICGKNPLVIAVPCHRVLAASSIGGYSAGLERKRFLLKIEGITL